MSDPTNGTRRAGRPREALPDVDTPNAFALWMEDKGLDVETVAKLLGCSVSSVYGYRRGNRPPSRKMAARIQRITEDRVTVDTWD